MGMNFQYLINKIYMKNINFKIANNLRIEENMIYQENRPNR